VKTEPNLTDAMVRAVALIRSGLDPAAVLLFGSHAAGRAVAASDVDLAVLMAGRKPDWQFVQRLRVDLEDLLRAPVDLVVLDDASPVLAMQVLREGRLLACRDEEALEAFTVRTLSEYADLKIIRREAEKRLLEVRRP
jgi:predicted nucleotidyltransferase